MCGIVGVLTSRANRVSIDEAALTRMRDRLAHRGPDDSGLHRPRSHVALAHRRLSVIDPGPAGHQPMTRPDGSTLVYNGELYNDAELRDHLRRTIGTDFATLCDTETVLELLASGDPRDTVPRMRGMFALAYYDAANDRLTIARDPLGIKPLYYWIGRTRTSDGTRTEVAFASECQALLEHPAIDGAPDFITISAYLTTIRTTLGRRTLYAGVNCVLPGEIIEFDLRGRDPVVTRSTPRWDVMREPPATDETIGSSVAAHLRSDVPLCALLSGGLDSSIIASIASRQVDTPLRTFCSGAADARHASDSDFAFARQVAEFLGTEHTEVPITRELFKERWPEMIARQALPLSTPNEVAINEVARAIRASGAAVTLSGEGADELFAGYEAPMAGAAAFVAAGLPEPALFQLTSNAWAPPRVKSELLNEDAWRLVERDEPLFAHYHDEFAAIQADLEHSDTPPEDRPLRAHLHFQQRINLPGLLQRLDSATMLESVEGRTPIADQVVAAASRALPMQDLYRAESEQSPPETKIALRRAFSDLPREVVNRPKASFPLPFQQWVADHATALDNEFARALFRRSALDLVKADPATHWNVAWPMINLALWRSA